MADGRLQAALWQGPAGGRDRISAILSTRRHSAAGKVRELSGVFFDFNRGGKAMPMRILSAATPCFVRSACAVVLLAFGLSGGTTQAADSILGGATVRILAIGDPAFQAMQRIHDELEKDAGGKIDLHVVDFDALHQQTLLNLQNKVSSYDIVAIEASQYGEYKPGLLDLTPLIKQSGMDGSDFQEAAWNGTTYEGKQLGVPFQPHSEILGYRKDLFAEAGLQPPKTEEELLIAAKKLHNSKPGLSGVCWPGARGTPVGQTFIYSMADNHQPMIDLAKQGDGFDVQNIKPANMKPMIDTPAGHTAAKFIKALMEVSPPGILNLAWDEGARLFGEGECAMIYVWSARSATWDLDPKSKAHGKVGYVPKPPGAGFPAASSLGGWFLSIPSNIDKSRIPLAWKTIEWMSSKRIMTILTEHGDCVAPRHSVAADPAVIERCPVVPAMDEFSKQGVFNGWERPPIAELQQVVDTVGAQMHEMTSGKITPDQAVANSQKIIDQMMRQAGYY
jgi:multiple sugar transport system substrate-binding protein